MHRNIEPITMLGNAQNEIFKLRVVIINIYLLFLVMDGCLWGAIKFQFNFITYFMIYRFQFKDYDHWAYPTLHVFLPRNEYTPLYSNTSYDDAIITDNIHHDTIFQGVQKEDGNEYDLGLVTCNTLFWKLMLCSLYKRIS